MAGTSLHVLSVLALSSLISMQCFTETSTTDPSTTTQNAVSMVTPQDPSKTRDTNGRVESENATDDAKKSDYLGYVITPLFFVLGVCGNAMTILVMVSRRFRSKTSSCILIALAVSDTVFSFIVPFNKLFFRNMLGYDPRALSSLGCSAFFVIHKTSKITSSWFVVFISFERFVAICFPFKARFICTRRNAIVGIVVVYVVVLAIAGAWDLSTVVVDNVCIPNHATPENAAMAEVFLFVGTSVYSYIPCSIMLVLTPMTCFNLVRQASLRRRLSTKNRKGVVDTARMTVMLIGVTIAFIVLVTPVAIAHNVSFALRIDLFETDYFGMVVAREILLVMEQLNYSINFLLYVMCSRDFRKRVAEILGCRKREGDSLTSHFSGIRTISSSVIQTTD